MNHVTKINLSKLKKCNQVWAGMPETKSGRLCQHCQHTVIDFRDKSDAEIAQAHLFTEGKVCGLYRKKQLEVPTKEKKSKKSLRWQGVYIGLFSLLSLESLAQEEKGNPASTEQREKGFEAGSHQVPAQVKSDRPSIPTDSLYITGTLKDAEGTPIPGANVIIKGTQEGASTDFDGNYRLNVTQAVYSLEKITLRYSSIGFKTQEVTLDSRAVAQK